MGCYTWIAVLLGHAAGGLSVDHIDEVGVCHIYRCSRMSHRIVIC